MMPRRSVWRRLEQVLTRARRQRSAHRRTACCSRIHAARSARASAWERARGPKMRAWSAAARHASRATTSPTCTARRARARRRCSRHRACVQLCHGRRHPPRHKVLACAAKHVARGAQLASLLLPPGHRIGPECGERGHNTLLLPGDNTPIQPPQRRHTPGRVLAPRRHRVHQTHRQPPKHPCLECSQGLSSPQRRATPAHQNSPDLHAKPMCHRATQVSVPADRRARRLNPAAEGTAHTRVK